MLGLGLCSFPSDKVPAMGGSLARGSACRAGAAPCPVPWAGRVPGSPCPTGHPLSPMGDPSASGCARRMAALAVVRCLWSAHPLVIKPPLKDKENLGWFLGWAGRWPVPPTALPTLLLRTKHSFCRTVSSQSSVTPATVLR